MEYEEFLKRKIKIIQDTGFESEVKHDFLFPFQRLIVKWALKKGKAGLFLDTGLGKTACFLSWADEVCNYENGSVLILAPLAVTKQIERESIKFGIKTNVCRTQKDVQKGINITNYEMLEHFNPSYFIGVVGDEMSILKSYAGTTKQKIINLFKNTKYKLSCTATPSPNNQMEILNQAEFLDVIKSCEALAIWFINDTQHSGAYVLKKHAVKFFWEWVSTWAVCISLPSDIGFDNTGYVLPPLVENEVIVNINQLSENFEDGFLRNIGTSATDFHKEKRFTCEKRAIKCAEIIAENPTKQFLIWCNTDYEADALKKYIYNCTEVRGSQSINVKEQAALDFIDGKIQVLISKPKIFGYGLNFQNCCDTIFCGIDYSYENYYQAIRRFWRFGQTKQVTSYIVIGSTEKQILDVIYKKSKLQEEMKLSMYGNIKEIQNSNIRGQKFKITLTPKTITIPNWLKSEKE